MDVLDLSEPTAEELQAFDVIWKQAWENTMAVRKEIQAGQRRGIIFCTCLGGCCCRR